MNFEDAQDAWELFKISPELTCTCDEFHTCQQCHEEEKKENNEDTNNQNRHSR
jgi:hypothetical protein